MPLSNHTSVYSPLDWLSRKVKTHIFLSKILDSTMDPDQSVHQTVYFWGYEGVESVIRGFSFGSNANLTNFVHSQSRLTKNKCHL